MQNQSQEQTDASIELAFEEIKYDRGSLYDHMLRTDKLRVIEEMDYIRQSFKESTVSQSEHSEGYFPVPIGAVPQPQQPVQQPILSESSQTFHSPGRRENLEGSATYSQFLNKYPIQSSDSSAIDSRYYNSNPNRNHYQSKSPKKHNVE